MKKQCTTSTGSRDWTKEEMMAYLDWSNAEGIGCNTNREDPTSRGVPKREPQAKFLTLE